VALDVPQAIGAPIALEFDPAVVQVLAFGRRREGHVGSQDWISGAVNSGGAL
jgi:hypothetical protein